MISFYKDEAGVVMYKDDTYLATEKFLIECPDEQHDNVAYPDEHAAFLGVVVLTCLVPAEASSTDKAVSE
jgi:hypothetical protein